MSTRVKWNGAWVDLNFDSRNINIANFLVGDQNTPWENYGSGYKARVSILEMTEKSHAACFLEASEGNITELVCKANELEFYSDSNAVISGIILFSANDYFTENKILPIGKLTEEEIERIIPQIAEKLHISPVSIQVDGQLREVIEFLNVRQVTEAKFSRQDCTEKEKETYKDLGIEQKITITYALQGSSIENSPKVDTIYLNENDYPIRGISNGIEWTIDWEGFGGELSE